MNKQERMEFEKEKIGEKKKKQEELDTWLKVIFLPLIIGFALVFSGITMVLFKVIGWILFLFGIFAGLAYLLKLYGTHKEKIQKAKEDVLSVVRRKKNG